MPAIQNQVWRGTKELVPGKAHRELTAGKLTITTDYHGPYAKCLAQQPAIGQSITGFPFACKVTSSKVVELDGDAARIDLILEAAQDESSIDPAPIGEPSYEIEFAEVERAIEQHPRCGSLKPDRNKYKDGVPSAEGRARTWEDWADLLDDEAEDGEGDYVEAGVDGAWTLAQYQELKEKGQDSYVVFQPIIRRTTEHFSRPTDLGAASGKQQDPPAAANFTHLTGYAWLAGVDRCTRGKRTYKRTTEWLGVAGEVSDLVYDDA